MGGATPRRNHMLVELMNGLLQYLDYIYMCIYTSLSNYAVNVAITVIFSLILLALNYVNLHNVL